jgi:hypothetical protein
MEQTGTYSMQVFEIPPPQVFDVSLPLTVSNGVPGPGAGNLETKASQDEYRFTVAAGQSVYVDALQCPDYAYLLWALVNDAGTTIKAANTCGDGRVDNLPAGRTGSG